MKLLNDKGKISLYDMIASAMILMIVLYARVNNEKYDFYIEYYVECEDGYDDAKDMANSYNNSI